MMKKSGFPLMACSFLCACGGVSDSATTGPSAIAVVPAGDDATALATVAVPASAPATAKAANPFATFNFQGGTAYPALATVSIGDATYNAASKMVYVPVSIDRATPVTLVARVGTVNSSAVAGSDFRATNTAAVFRPGDPLVQTIAIPILAFKPGNGFWLKNWDTQGGKIGTVAGKIFANAKVAPTAMATGVFRVPRTYPANGDLRYSLDKTSFRYSDQGSATEWATSLSQGREQLGNAETGLYLDQKLFPGVEAPIAFGDDGLVIHSQKLGKPITWLGRTYNHGASVLDGRNLTAVQITYGRYEWTAKMPSRRGSWPALWLLTDRGWPPEIDVYEGFSQDPNWNLDTMLSSTIHGGANLTKTFSVATWTDAYAMWRTSGLTTAFHQYAVDIQPDYITWYVDGIEVNQMVNPFVGRRWAPIMDVAVKSGGDYAGGTGDMVVRSFKVYANPAL